MRIQRQMPEVKNKSNCVYIITCQEYKQNGLYKVGLTKNLKSRVRQYKTAFPSHVEVVYTRKVEKMKLAEKLIHHFLEKDRYNQGGGTEWFKTNDVQRYIQVVDETCDFIEGNKKEKNASCWEKMLAFCCGK